MAFSVKYKKLFEVELRQNYYLNDGAAEFAALAEADQQARLAAYRKTYNLLDEFAFFATPETRRAMAGLGMVCKTTATGFFVAVEVEETTPGTFVPRRVPPSPLRLRFALRLKAPAFTNYTNLSLAGRPRNLYYFSNLRRSHGLRRRFPFLSIDPPIYRNGTLYRAGDLVRRRGNTLVQTLALRDGTHARPPADTTGSLDWRSLEGRGYVNTNDHVVLYPPVFTLAFPAAVSVLAARFVLVDPDDGQHDGGAATSPDGQPLRTARLDLRGLEPGRDPVAPGRYRLDVVDQATDTVAFSEEIYLDPELPAQHIFGLVEIFHLVGAGQGVYRLLDQASRLRLTEPESTLVIHFLNRHTFWRYHFTTPPEHAPNPIDFVEVDPLQYVTRVSLPLTQSFIELEDDEGQPLPNPAGGLVKPEEDRVFSEVYLLNN